MHWERLVIAAERHSLLVSSNLDLVHPASYRTCHGGHRSYFPNELVYCHSLLENQIDFLSGASPFLALYLFGYAHHSGTGCLIPMDQGRAINPLIFIWGHLKTSLDRKRRPNPHAV
jgi:hypothetical protein